MSHYIKFQGRHIPDHPHLKCFCLTFDRRRIKTDRQKEKLFLFNSSITQGRTSNLGFIVFTTLYSHYSYCHQPLGRKLPFLGTYSCVSDTHAPQPKSSQPRKSKNSRQLFTKCQSHHEYSRLSPHCLHSEKQSLRKIERFRSCFLIYKSSVLLELA